MEQRLPDLRALHHCESRWHELMHRWHNRSPEGAHWNCDICQVEWHLGPVVNDSIWRAICIGHLCEFNVRMCLTCMEKGLGRPLEKKDMERELLWNDWRNAATWEPEL